MMFGKNQLEYASAVSANDFNLINTLFFITDSFGIPKGKRGLKIYHLLSFSDLPTNTVLSVFPDSSEVFGGSVLYEKCSTDARPDPHIFLLYFNGNFISNSSSGEFNVTVYSDGVYTCAPINTVGSGDNASFSVTIFGKNPSALLIGFLNEIYIMHQLQLYSTLQYVW